MPRLHRRAQWGYEFYRLEGPSLGVADAGAGAAVDGAAEGGGGAGAGAAEVGAGGEVLGGGLRLGELLRLGEDEEGVGGEGDERDYGDAEEGEVWKVHSLLRGDDQGVVLLEWFLVGTYGNGNERRLCQCCVCRWAGEGT